MEINGNHMEIISDINVLLHVYHIVSPISSFSPAALVCRQVLNRSSPSHREAHGQMAC